MLWTAMRVMRSGKSPRREAVCALLGTRGQPVRSRRGSVRNELILAGNTLPGWQRDLLALTCQGKTASGGQPLAAGFVLQACELQCLPQSTGHVLQQISSEEAQKEMFCTLKITGGTGKKQQPCIERGNCFQVIKTCC
ncbi:small membrane A-kinase anchor protein isoform X2 [Corvus cornix cornix]|uniref:small membrane A-kinase anchor protein isoform X2 n=2 Tax=Corvus TaxID=30420 RepID=UPI00081674EE|nr:PREDICTED: small membrane A-kinase anchor protein isoform X2 [Corvus brachyrhynchos]XP_019145821.2 small membrane A-kinase anchor protein isoform X2 [Corvus cornix cornix]